jgi:hypothetical protein
MVQESWLTPFAQVGQEIRIEIRTSFHESRLAALGHRFRLSDVPLLPEQRIEDRYTADQRKAENLLQSVRLGAVRR